jgi:hypothetical protein
MPMGRRRQSSARPALYYDYFPSARLHRRLFAPWCGVIVLIGGRDAAFAYIQRAVP